MKTCILCESEQPDISLVQVVPATWTGFHGFVEICSACRTSERFQKLVKQKKIVASASQPAPREEPVKTTGAIEIAHRRTGAVLQRCEGSTLAHASLVGAALSGADLHGAAMSSADLHGADLRLADLGAADLRNADLRNANLRGADLCGADLRGARLHRADRQHALFDERTRWPDGFDPGGSGAKRERG